MRLFDVLVLAQAVWGGLLVATAILKVLEYGPYDFFRHFTNWSWTFQAFFYSLAVSVACWLPLARGVVAACYFPLHGIVWAVAIAVQVLLVVDPDFITSLADKFDLGLIIFGNDVYHVWPVIALTIYTTLQYALIFSALHRWFSSARKAGTCAYIMLVLYQLVLGGLVVLGAYLITLVLMGTTVQEVYQIDFPLGFIIAAFTLVTTAVNAITLSVFLCCCRLGSPELEPYTSYLDRRIYETDYELLTTVPPRKPLLVS